MLLEETNDRLMMKDRLPRQATPGLGPGSLSSNEKRWCQALTNPRPDIITETLNNRWGILLRVLLVDSGSILDYGNVQSDETRDRPVIWDPLNMCIGSYYIYDANLCQSANIKQFSNSILQFPHPISPLTAPIWKLLASLNFRLEIKIFFSVLMVELNVEFLPKGRWFCSLLSTSPTSKFAGAI